MPQLQQWLRARFSEKCPRTVEAVINRAVQPMIDGHVRRAVATVVAETVGAHVEFQLTDVTTAPGQSPLGVRFVDLVEIVLERRSRALAVSEATLPDPRDRPADLPTQVLAINMEPSVQRQVDEAYDKKDTPVYLASDLRRCEKPS